MRNSNHDDHQDSVVDLVDNPVLTHTDTVSIF